MSVIRNRPINDVLELEAISVHNARKDAVKVNVAQPLAKSEVMRRWRNGEVDARSAQLAIRWAESNPFGQSLDESTDDSDIFRPLPGSKWPEFVPVDRKPAPPIAPVTPSNELEFCVLGEPVPKGRPRALIRAGGIDITGQPRHYAQIYTPQQTAKFELAVRRQAYIAACRCGWTFSDKDHYALHVEIFRRHREKGGDFDNYIKAICDSLNPKLSAAGIWFDDRRVTEWSGFMRQDAVKPRIYVKVSKI